MYWLLLAYPISISHFFFLFIFISWRLITLQYCSGFCQYIHVNVRQKPFLTLNNRTQLLYRRQCTQMDDMLP